MNDETEKDLREKIEWLETQREFREREIVRVKDELARANLDRQALRHQKDLLETKAEELEEELNRTTTSPKRDQEIERLRARLGRSETLIHLLREGLACGKLSGLLVRVIDFCRESEGQR